MKNRITLALLIMMTWAQSAFCDTDQSTTKDWVTGAPRQAIHVASWPGGKKVAVCFIFYVEHFGFGEGPNFRPDMLDRKPDVVDEGFRQYAIEFGVNRVGRVFKEEGVPVSIALNSLFPDQHAKTWESFRALVPTAPIIGHGFNNTTQLLPLGQGVEVQRQYIDKTLDMLQKETGVRPQGWSSPSVYADADTFSACAAAGLKYSLDSMDSDLVSRLITKSGPLTLIPYPSTPVDMGQFLQRHKEPRDIERSWCDYVSELNKEAENDPSREAVIVAIGVHPFVFGTPNGGLALRRTLEFMKSQKFVWLTDVQAVMDAVR